MGWIFARTQIFLPPACFPVNVHYKLVMRRKPMELQRSFLKAGREWAAHAVYSWDKDTYVPTWMVYPLYEVCRNPKNSGSYREQPMPFCIKRINRNTPTKYGISSGGIFIKPINKEFWNHNRKKFLFCKCKMIVMKSILTLYTCYFSTDSNFCKPKKRYIR